jgi:molybdenum cofactor cytidylyltransferase
MVNASTANRNGLMTNDSKFAAVLLAAGLSRRAGPANKLLRDIDGNPMIHRAAVNLLASKASAIIVVTGHEQSAVQDALAGQPISWAHNANFASGMASSIGVGIRALDTDIAGALICLADMPHIEPATFNVLIDAFDPEHGAEICVPAHQGRRGNPALFARRFFDDLCHLEGDRGGKMIIDGNPNAVVEIDTGDPGIHIDHDTMD